MGNPVTIRIKILNICLFLILHFSSFEFSFPEEFSDPGLKYLFSELSLKNGLPQNTVYTVTQDKDGFIWIGTDRGVARFDGKKFKYYNSYNNPEIKNNSVTALLSEKNGRLLIGTFGGGLLGYENGVFTQLGLGKNSEVIRIWTLFIDPGKNLWIGTTGNGLICLTTKGSIKYFLKNNNHGNITSVTGMQGGDILAASETGIFRISGDKTSSIDLSEIKGSPNIMTIMMINGNSLYVGTDNGLVVGKIYKNRIKSFSVHEDGNIIRKIFRDRSENIWLVTDKGLKKIEGGRVVPFISRDPFFYGPLMTIFQGPEDNLWIGSSGSGLRILRERNFFSLKYSQKFFTGHINSICVKNGTLVAGSRGNGVLILKKNRSYSYSKINGLISNHVNSVYPGIGGSILAGTDIGLNIITIPSNPAGKPAIETRLPGIKVQSFFKDSSNNILIGTMKKGLYQLEGNIVSEYKKYTESISDSILCITEDKNKNILIGTDKGLKTLPYKDSGKIQWPKIRTIKGPVYDIFIDRDNNLWAGTRDHGLVVLTGDKVFFAGKSNNMLLNPIYKIFRDKHDKLWLSTNNGILSLKRHEILKYLQGIIKTFNLIQYSEIDGISSSVFSGGTQPAGWKTPNGNIYFPSRRGITYFNPEKFYFNRVVPGIKIEKLVVNGENFSKKGEIILNPGVKKLSIYFSVISFTNRHKVVFSYKLFGYDKEWRYSSSGENVIIYRNLLPGEYRFNLAAANCDGFWNHSGVSLTFRIKFPFYKTVWFYFIIIFLIYIFSPFIYRWIMLRVRTKNEEVKKYESSKLTKVDSHLYLQKLRKIVEKDKLFLDPNIKIRDISSRMGIPRKVLSQVINELLEENFKNFINRYRIEEAKKKLTDPDEKDFILLKIIYDTGFNSKSVFNASFKRITGMSPSEYRKKHIR